MTDYEFSNDWFQGNVFGNGPEIDIPNILTMLFDRFKDHQRMKILEIGCYEGQSTTFFGKTFAKKSKTEIYCIDDFSDGGGIQASDVEACFDSNMLLLKQRTPNLTLRIIKKPSIKALSSLIAEGHQQQFDFIYIDGSHTAKDVLADAVLAFELLKVNGLLVFDDYLWRYGYEQTGDLLNIAKTGIDAFVNVCYDNLRILHNFPSYQLYLERLK